MKKNELSVVDASRQFSGRLCGGERTVSVKNLAVFILVLSSCSTFAQALSTGLYLIRVRDLTQARTEKYLVK